MNNEEFANRKTEAEKLWEARWGHHKKGKTDFVLSEAVNDLVEAKNDYAYGQYRSAILMCRTGVEYAVYLAVSRRPMPEFPVGDKRYDIEMIDGQLSSSRWEYLLGQMIIHGLADRRLINKINYVRGRGNEIAHHGQILDKGLAAFSSRKRRKIQYGDHREALKVLGDAIDVVRGLMRRINSKFIERQSTK